MEREPRPSRAVALAAFPVLASGVPDASAGPHR